MADEILEKRAAVYVRVSTQDQADCGYSIEQQEKMCRAYITSRGWECVRTYSDPGFSGRTLDRPGLQGMIDAIKRGTVEAVVVFKLDRLSRKQRDTLTLIEDVLNAYNCILVSLNETLDTSTPWGRAMIGILSSFNQMECETIQLRTSVGRIAKAKEGGYAGGRRPFGYKIINGEMVVDKDEGRLVRMIFDMYKTKGMSANKIAEALNGMGVTTKDGFKFRHTTVLQVVRNEDTYRGYYTFKGEKVQGHHQALLKPYEFVHDVHEDKLNFQPNLPKKK